MARKPELIEVAGRTVSISNPDKIFFRAAGYTKRDLVSYYLAVQSGVDPTPIGLINALKAALSGS